MSKNKYTENECITALNKKNDCTVDATSQVITTITSPNKGYRGDLGNKSWGRIDYLVNHQGYRHITKE